MANFSQVTTMNLDGTYLVAFILSARRFPFNLAALVGVHTHFACLKMVLLLRPQCT